MVDEFSRFAGMPKRVIEGEDVADMVGQAVFLMRVGHPDIDIEAEIKHEPMRAQFDRRLISQALTNIIKNATEAIEVVPAEELGKGRIDVIAARENDDIVIDVIDNGIGLPKVSRARLLEPYVTTREKGTGLGLAIVGRVLEDHGGRIELNDAADIRPGARGAWMRLRFAISGHAPQAEVKEPGPETKQPASETNGPAEATNNEAKIESAVAAIKRGAYDFIERPFKSDRLILVATRALETSRLKREVKELKQLAPAASILTGRSACMNQLRQTIERAAKANSRILIVGPSGSGKELAARTLHNASGRAEGPFVVINAAAITPERMEVELFGIEQSNGEHQRKPGALEEAHGGTLFIDEIGDMPRETQNKILRVLVDQTFQRSGGTAKVNVDVRIISSTARNLEEEIAEGRFREDLYHRLSVVPIRVPPLSERREDIPELIDYFMDQISVATGLPKRQIGQDAMAVVQSHVWPR